MIVCIFGRGVRLFPLELIFLIYYTKAIVSGVGDLVLRLLLGFILLCLFILFLLRCSSSLLELDEEESRKEVELILHFLLCEHLSKGHRFILCLRSSELFSQRSVFSSALRPSYFSSNLRKKLLQRFSHIWELRSFHV